MRTDPLEKLHRRAEMRATDLHREIKDPKLPRALRAEGRVVLRGTFRALSNHPGRTAAEKRAWVRKIRALIGSMETLAKAIRAARRPPPPFYENGRLAVIRVMNPVRIRFATGKLQAEEFVRRLAMLERQQQRLDWLWERLKRSRPELFEMKDGAQRPDIRRDTKELVWGRVRQSN